MDTSPSWLQLATATDGAGPAPVAVPLAPSAGAARSEGTRVAPAQRLRLPGVEQRWRHARHYWLGTLRNLLVPHDLRPERATRRYSALVQISDRLVRDWHALFGPLPEPRAAVPYLTNQGVGTLLYTRLFADLGLNFRHLLHLRHETVHVAGAALCALARTQQLETALLHVRRLCKGQALVVLRTEVRRRMEDGGQLLAVVTDEFVVRHLPEPVLRWLPVDRDALREMLSLRSRSPQLPGSAELRATEAIPLPADMGRRYGRVSGDHNPVHTTALAARLFGFDKPFAQGLALRNAVVRALVMHRVPVERLSITFAARATLGQTLQLAVGAGRFELLDAQGRVVAFGETGA